MIKFLTIAKNIFTYGLPIGTFLYYAVVEKLLSNEVPISAKIGVGGLTAIIIIAILGVLITKKALNSRIADLTDKTIECLDNNEKKQLIIKKQKIKSFMVLFDNAVAIVPFVAMLIMVGLIEQKMIEVKGILFAIIIELIIGFAFNIWLQDAKIKEKL